LHQETAGNYATIKWIVAKHTLFGHGKGMQIYVNDGKPIGARHCTSCVASIKIEKSRD